MELDAKQWRICKSIGCDQLDGKSCKAETCLKPTQADKEEMLMASRGERKGVKDD